MPNNEPIDEMIRRYADGPKLLEDAVAGIPADELRFRPGPEHWSIHENVVHVADCEIVWAARTRYVLAEPGAVLVGFDQERWARALHYAALPLGTSLAVFRGIRDLTTDMLRRAPADAWEQIGRNTESGSQTLEWIIDHLADHVPYHLRTIAKRRRQYAERNR